VMLQCGAFVLQETKRLEIKKFIVKMGAKKDNLHVEFYQYLNSAHALTAQSDTAIHATTASSFARGSSITGSSSMQSINKHNIDAESSLLEGKNNKTNKKQTESYRPNHHDKCGNRCVSETFKRIVRSACRRMRNARCR